MEQENFFLIDAAHEFSHSRESMQQS